MLGNNRRGLIKLWDGNICDLFYIDIQGNHALVDIIKSK